MTKGYAVDPEIDADPTSFPNAASRKIVKRISRSKLQLQVFPEEQFEAFLVPQLADLFRDGKPRGKASENYYRGVVSIFHFYCECLLKRKDSSLLGGRRWDFFFSRFKPND